MHETIANATFRIICGNSSGSGFSFRNPNIIITNYHVIKHHLQTNAQIFAETEHRDQLPLTILAYSSDDNHDFAILQINSTLPEVRTFLQPAQNLNIERGLKIIFSGFPHGIPDLLVHEAIVSGPTTSQGFYIDGSVNGGNSGGPIVEMATGNVIGIITQRRFLGADQLEQMREEATHLANHCSTLANRGSVNIMGINFGDFANMMAQGITLIDKVLQANANSGIGIGFRIEHANNEYDRLSLP